MHPLTVYEIAMLEHQQATDQRLHDHLVALRRRARPMVTPAPRRSRGRRGRRRTA